MKPAYKNIIFNESAPSPIKTKLYAGISESKPSQAGWYVFCNGRMVLEADQSIITGWGEGEGTTIPKYHNQFARFRGYVFFDSDAAEFLPWNTTKTGVDTDSRIYQAVRLEMIKLMRPVIDFLNRLDAEKDDDGDNEKPLEIAVKAAQKTKISEVRTDEVFKAPTPTTKPKAPKMGRIQYSKPNNEIEIIKEILEARSNKEVGEKTFEYFLEMEG